MATPPSFDEVAAFLGLSESRKKLIARAFQALRVELEDSFTLEQVRQSADDMWNSEGERETSIEVDDDQHVLMQRMQRLDERECTILELRYGLAGGVPMSLNEIGRRLGITGEWVRKIQSRRAAQAQQRGSRTGPKPPGDWLECDQPGTRGNRLGCVRLSSRVLSCFGLIDRSVGRSTCGRFGLIDGGVSDLDAQETGPEVGVRAKNPHPATLRAECYRRSAPGLDGPGLSTRTQSQGSNSVFGF